MQKKGRNVPPRSVWEQTYGGLCCLRGEGDYILSGLISATIL